jgi:ElaB/YqjD/DUF883 family membrane-anchored ribosome-binding protein
MPNNETTHRIESVSDKVPGIGDSVSDMASQVKDRAADLGRTATQVVDDNRGAAATGLDKAASSLRDNAQSLPGGEKVSSLAHSAAETLSSTAGYVRTHDANRMMTDVEALVKNNPGPSLLVAAAVGFLVGRAFSND